VNVAGFFDFQSVALVTGHDVGAAEKWQDKRRRGQASAGFSRPMDATRLGLQPLVGSFGLPEFMKEMQTLNLKELMVLATDNASG